MIQVIARTYRDKFLIVMRFNDMESAQATLARAESRFHKYCNITDDAGDKHFGIDIKYGFTCLAGQLLVACCCTQPHTTENRTSDHDEQS